MQKHIKAILFVAVLALALACLLGLSVSAATHSVSDETELTDAITAAADGDTIEITANITVTAPLVITKSLTFTGAEGIVLDRSGGDTTFPLGVLLDIYDEDNDLDVTLTLAGAMTFQSVNRVVNVGHGNSEWFSGECEIIVQDSVQLVSSGNTGIYMRPSASGTATLTMTGGTIANSGGTYGVALFGSGDTVANISGGVLTGASTTIWIESTHATANIYGSAIVNSGTNDAIRMNAAGTVNIYGSATVRSTNGKHAIYIHPNGAGANITVRGSATVSSTATAGVNTGVTFNSGKTDVTALTASAAYSAITIFANATVNVQESAHVTSTAFTIRFYAPATLNISGGTIDNTGASSKDVITVAPYENYYRYLDAEYNPNPSTLEGFTKINMSGGLIDGSVRNAMYIMSSTKLTMTGGTISANGVVWNEYENAYQDPAYSFADISGTAIMRCTGTGKSAKAFQIIGNDTRITIGGSAQIIGGSAASYLIQGVSTYGGALTVTINGSATLSNATTALIYQNSTAYGLNVTVNGGTLTAAGNIIKSNSTAVGATVTLNGGTLTSSANNAVYLNAAATHTNRVTVAGATVSGAPATTTEGAVYMTGAGTHYFTITSGSVASSARSAVSFGNNGGTNYVTIGGGTLSTSYEDGDSWRGVVDCTGSTTLEMTGGTVVDDADNSSQNGILFRYGTHSAEITGGTVHAGYTAIHVWYQATAIDLTVGGDATLECTKASGGYGIIATCKGDGSTITIEEDAVIDTTACSDGQGIRLDQHTTGSGVNLAGTVTLTINGGTVLGGASGSAVVVAAPSGATAVTVTGGALTGNNGIYLSHPVALSVSGGSITATNGSAIRVVHGASHTITKSEESNTVNFNGTSVTVTGGTLTATEAGVYFLDAATTAHSVTMSGVTVDAPAAVRNNAASTNITVNGGDFEDCDEIILFNVNTTGTRIIGATGVAMTLPASGKLFVLAASGDNQPTVKIANVTITPVSLDGVNFYDTNEHASAGVVAYIGTYGAVGCQYFGSLAAAIAGASSGDTVVVYRSTTLDAPITLPAITLTITSTSAVTVSTSGTAGSDANTMFNVTGTTNLTLNGSVSYVAGYRVIYMSSAANSITLTLGGNASIRSLTNTAVYINQATTANLTLQDSALIATSDAEYATTAYYGIYLQSVTTGNFTMTGGAIRAKNTGFLTKATNGTVDLSGGVIASANVTPVYLQGGALTARVRGTVQISSGLDGTAGTNGNGFWIKTGAVTLDFSGGSLTSYSTGIGVCSAATVNISGGTITCGGWGPLAVAYDSCGGAVANITGGTLTGTGSYVLYTAEAAGTINVYGGNVSGRIYANVAGSAINLYGGNFTRASGSADLANANKGAINVYGGTFTLAGDTGIVLKKGSGTLNMAGGYVVKGGEAPLADVDYADASKIYTGDTIIKRDAGAQVRMVAESAGLRFISHVDADTVDFVEDIADADSISYYTIIFPAAYVASLGGNVTPANIFATLSASSPKQYVTVEADDGLIEDGEGGYYIRTALVNIKNYTRDFACVAYIQYTVNGKTVYQGTVFNSTTDVRNVQDVAQAALDAYDAGTASYNATQLAILTEFAENDGPTPAAMLVMAPAPAIRKEYV